MDPGEFRRACAQFATGVAIAAACDPAGVPHGLTINSFTSVSLTPPLVLLCIDNRAAVLNVFREASHFSINILHATQEHLSTRFATRPDDRFAGVDWVAGPHGTPLLQGVVAVLECARTQLIVAGDHTIVIGEAVHAAVEGGEPLVYFGSGYARLG
ncbi:MAG: flavin reductase family protein [Acidobacteria bacterium]|nr:flavin reductase family protein [Acidobacteriota bacterium]